MPTYALLSMGRPELSPQGDRRSCLPRSNPVPQATNIATETCQYEDQEQQLMIDCVEQFCT